MIDLDQTPTRRESAVLVPLYRDPAGELRLVLVCRTPGGIHGGQLAFPGGMREAADASARDTALREAYEEIGLEPARVEWIADLPVVETRTSRFVIAPVLARIERPAAWRPAPEEVAEILEPSVRALTHPESRGESVEHFATWPGPRAVPHIMVGEHRLWGATLRILDELLPRLLAGEWRL